MYVYKALHHLNDNLKDRGLSVRVGLWLDLNLSLSLLGLISVGMHNDRCSPKPSHQLVYKTLSSSLY